MTRTVRRAALFATLLLAAALQPAATSAASPRTDDPAQISYEVRMRLADPLDSLEGSVEARFTNTGRAAVDAVTFLLFPNLAGGATDVREVRVEGRAASPAFTLQRSRMIVPLPVPLPPGRAVTISLQFTTVIPSAPDGGSGIFCRGEGYSSLAYAFPLIPAQGAWNDSLPAPWGDVLVAEAARFHVLLSIPTGYEAAAPGAVQSRGSGQGRREIEITHGPARDLYVAVVKGLARREARVGPVTVVSWAAPRAGEFTRTVLTAAQGALEGFSRRFGDYPYRTLTVVSLPLEVYGCEFSGIVLVSSRLGDPAAQVGGVPPLVLAEATTVHEVAHQWFFGLVGSDQLIEPWLDEGLAQYATLLFYRDRDGEPGARGYRQSFESRWARVGRAGIPIGRPVAAYTEKEYAAIVYGRAPLFLEALADRMGRPAFDALLRDWCTRFKWKIARGRDFLSLAGEACGCSLDSLAAEWGALP